MTEGKHTPGPGKTTLADGLRAARALIDTPEKWCKEGFEHAGRYCALGAVSLASNGNCDFDESWYVGNTEKLANALLMQLPEPFVFVSDFNDDPATTHADVMALFDRAINAADATGAS